MTSEFNCTALRSRSNTRAVPKFAQFAVVAFVADMITYAEKVDEDSNWIELAAAARNVIAYLLQRRETATGAAEHQGGAPVAVSDADGQASERE
jgi:hypothetical protein